VPDPAWDSRCLNGSLRQQPFKKLVSLVALCGNRIRPSSSSFDRGEHMATIFLTSASTALRSACKDTERSISLARAVLNCCVGSGGIGNVGGSAGVSWIVSSIEASTGAQARNSHEPIISVSRSSMPIRQAASQCS
jgi:hypothetical protein